MITKILNWCGYFNQRQIDELRKEVVELKKKNSDYNILIFDFDRLLENYGGNQLNSLFYKLINLVRNDQNKNYLLERWTNRVNNANQTLVKG